MSAAAQYRSAQVKFLSDQANMISALLATIHILPPETQDSALLDCSSLADDLARDLDAFVGALS